MALWGVRQGAEGCREETPGAVFLMEGNPTWKVRVLRKRGCILRIEFNWGT